MKLSAKYAMICFCMLLFFLPLHVTAAGRVQPVDGMVTVVIDPGHGGSNKGTEAGHTIEKQMTLITAQAMYDELTKFDNIQVYMTRTNDKDLDLAGRAEFAHSVDADFLFSIHYNASEFHTMYGTEVWVSCETPYNAYGYQFGFQHLKAFQDMGLYVRGVKCRRSTEHGHDYYGIIRQSALLDIPAAIIEHCYVDEERDAEYVENEDDYRAFGIADAHSVARYFGLKSEILGIDYSDVPDSLPAASAEALVPQTIQDQTPPDICEISILECDYENGLISLSVSAVDYDTPLIYYDYSIDGGKTWSRLETWPGSDTLEWEYVDTFRLNLTIPGGRRPSVKLRAYNISDLYTESNLLIAEKNFARREGDDSGPAASAIYEKRSPETPATEPPEHTHTSVGTTTFEPVVSEVIEQPTEDNLVVFLKLCLAIVFLLFLIILTTQIVNYRRRKRRRRR
ncbi:MAG: N-acetylmuramoyl-L-alanine amidase [Lachnospiraceae bacterium]|nr:N-acetylmuramoyl-L-alanine amidase [Lachnospiraceae bacterium]